MLDVVVVCLAAFVCAKVVMRVSPTVGIEGKARAAMFDGVLVVRFSVLLLGMQMG